MEEPAGRGSDMAGGNHSSNLLPFPQTQQTSFQLKNKIYQEENTLSFALF